MTWIEFVKFYEPNITDDNADFILWNESAFPMTTDLKFISKQIYSAVRAMKNNIKRCCLCSMKYPYHKQGCLERRTKI
jgi:hypothetical protein